MLAGCVKFESLLDGSVDLAAISLLNDALSAQSENQRRYEDWLKRNGNG